MSQQHIVDIITEIKRLWNQYDENKAFRKEFQYRQRIKELAIKKLQESIKKDQEAIDFLIKESVKITDQIRDRPKVDDQNE